MADRACQGLSTTVRVASAATQMAPPINERLAMHALAAAIKTPFSAEHPLIFAIVQFAFVLFAFLFWPEFRYRARL